MIALVLTILIWFELNQSESVDSVERSENVSGTLTTVAQSHNVGGNDAVFRRKTLRAGDAFDSELRATSREFAEEIRQNQERIADQLASNYANHVSSTLAYRREEHS